MNYVVAILSALPLLGIVMRHTDGFNRLFGIASFLFALAFYCLPLAFAVEAGSLSYVGRSVSFHAADRNSALFAMLIFSLGFLGCDFTYRIKNRQAEPLYTNVFSRKSRRITPVLIILFVWITSAFLVYYLISTNFYEYTRLVRTNEVEGSYILTTFLLALYYANCIMLIMYLKDRRYHAAILSFLLAFLLIINFGGRMQVGIVLLIPCVHFIRHQGLLVIVGIAGGIISLPMAINGKEIIASAVAGGNIIDVISYAYQKNINIGEILDNFSHPLVSFYYSPLLIKEIGYRFFWDIPQGFLFYLRLIGLDFGDSLTYYNTEIIIGQRESVVPPGFLAFGFVQAGYFGVFVMGAIYRMAGYLAEFVKKGIGEKALAADFFLAFLAANTFYIGEVRGLVLTFLFPCALLYIIVRLTSAVAKPVSAKRVRRPSYSKASYTAFGPPRG